MKAEKIHIVVTDEMVERAITSYCGEHWEQDYYPEGIRSLRADFRAALEAAFNV